MNKVTKLSEMPSNESNDPDNSPFHAGEKEMQARAGKREAMEKFGKRVITNAMPDQHRDFYAQLPFLIVGNVDNKGWPWVSILSGKPGFLQSPDPKTLNLRARAVPNDPLHDSIKLGSPLGMLGIELGTRRRNRLNGRISQINHSSFAVEVDQAFGNCPQYIQTRSIDFVRDPQQQDDPDNINTNNVTKLCELDAAASAMISRADTFFVSSFLPIKDEAVKEGVDVSHRGGNPGFIKVEGNRLTIADYPGNYHFNTLGNFLLNPKAGLTFIDFETGDLLLLTGSVELLDDTEEEIISFKGAVRGWRFTLDHALRLTNALPFRSTLKEYSMNSLITGNWNQAKLDLAAKNSKHQWRSFTVTRIVDEGSVIRSFYLQPESGEGLAEFEAGQFLTISISPEGTEKQLTRTYTVSSAPGENYYRISVKRELEGLVSKYLHDKIHVGDSINIRKPVGEFYLDPTKTRPAALLAGGVGITPMISMAQHVLRHGIITRHIRPLHIFHCAQTVEQRAFAKEFRNLEAQTQKRIRYYSLISQPTTTDQLGKNFNGSGHITADILRQKLPLDDYDFYLCGPASFMQAMYDNLMSLGVSDQKIFAESFGPALLERKQTENEAQAQAQAQAQVQPQAEEAESSVIKFAKSGFQQTWSKGEETLLEVAENHGLTPNFSCRNGVCGSCAVKLTSGSVSYRSKPNAQHDDDEVLICCAVPAQGSDMIELEL